MTESGTAPRDSRLAPLAAAVRERRRALGLRQEEVADLAGCSERFVFTLERAKPSLHLAKVLDVLGVLGMGLTVGPGRGEVSGNAPAPGAPQ